MVTGFKNYPRDQDLSIWIARDADKPAIVASGEVVLRLEDNLHLVLFNLAVLPEYRQRGLGRQLQSRIGERARGEKRRLLSATALDRIPAGAAFVTRIGAQSGLDVRGNRLVLADLDRDLLHAWQERARERAAGFEMGVWEGLFRKRGLGRWLKDAMQDKILAERPQAKYVRAGNADMNAPMLKINTELGFTLYDALCFWQVETEQV